MTETPDKRELKVILDVRTRLLNISSAFLDARVDREMKQMEGEGGYLIGMLSSYIKELGGRCDELIREVNDD